MANAILNFHFDFPHPSLRDGRFSGVNPIYLLIIWVLKLIQTTLFECQFSISLNFLSLMPLLQIFVAKENKLGRDSRRANLWASRKYFASYFWGFLFNAKPHFKFTLFSSLSFAFLDWLVQNYLFFPKPPKTKCLLFQKCPTWRAQCLQKWISFLI